MNGEPKKIVIPAGEDHAVIPLNEFAYEQLRCPKKMLIVSDATHLFEEPGTMEKVAELARLVSRILSIIVRGRDDAFSRRFSKTSSKFS